MDSRPPETNPPTMPAISIAFVSIIDKKLAPIIMTNKLIIKFLNMEVITILLMTQLCTLIDYERYIKCDDSKYRSNTTNRNVVWISYSAE